MKSAARPMTARALLNYVIIRQVPRLYRLRPRSAPRAPSAVASSSTHKIDTSKCLKCGACMEKCRFGAIEKH